MDTPSEKHVAALTLVETKSDWQNFLTSYKESLAVIRETLETFWRAAPLTLFFPAFALWVFMKRLGLEEYFWESISSVSALTILTVFAALLAFSLSTVICAPFMMAAPIVMVFSPISPVPDGAASDAKRMTPKRISQLVQGYYLLPSLVMLVTICFWRSATVGGLMTMMSIFTIVPSAVLAVLLPRWCSYGVSWKKRGEALLLLALAQGTLLLCAIFPLQLLGDLVSSAGAGSLAQDAVLKYATLICLFCMVPGFVTLKGRLQLKANKEAIKGRFVVFGILCYFCLVVMVLLSPVSTKVWESVHLFDNELHVYQLKDEERAKTFRSAGLQVADRKPEGEKVGYFVAGYVHYNFGGLKILCAAPIDKAWLVAGPEAGAPGRRLGRMNCVPVRSDELFPILR